MNKISPINPNANNFSNFDGRNSHNNQNFKDSSKDSKEKQNFLDTIQQILKEQSEERNNDSTNTITNSYTTSYTTAQILTPTNPYGSGNGRNNRFDRHTQEQSAIIEKDGRSNTTAHNGGFTQLLGEKDKRSRRVGDGSGKITRLRNAKAYTTATERSRLYELETKHKQTLNAYKEPYRQNLLSTIENNLQYIADNPTQKTKENIHKDKSKSNDDFGIGM